MLHNQIPDILSLKTVFSSSFSSPAKFLELLDSQLIEFTQNNLKKRGNFLQTGQTASPNHPAAHNRTFISHL
jgi:hypothetical protein